MLQSRIQAEMEAVRSSGLTRQITDLSFIDAVRAKNRQGKEYLVFSSNNYLGLTFHPKVREAAARAVQNTVPVLPVPV